MERGSGKNCAMEAISYSCQASEQCRLISLHRLLHAIEKVRWCRDDGGLFFAFAVPVISTPPVVVYGTGQSTERSRGARSVRTARVRNVPYGTGIPVERGSGKNCAMEAISYSCQASEQCRLISLHRLLHAIEKVRWCRDDGGLFLLLRFLSSRRHLSSFMAQGNRRRDLGGHGACAQHE